MPTLFSLPPELRDMIYDTLHQHEQQLNSEHMSFVMPFTHVRNISRTFRNEYNKRHPAKSRLVVPQRDWCWGKFMPNMYQNYLQQLAFTGPLWGSAENKKLPQRLPKLVTFGRVASYTDLELNFDVYDEVRRPRDFLCDFVAYSTWIDTLLYRERHLPRVSCGGEVHLRLFFSYVGSFDSLRRLIEKENWFNLHCSTISLVLYSGGDGIPNEASLSRARVLAVWTKSVGWQIEKEPIHSLRAEIVQG